MADETLGHLPLLALVALGSVVDLPEALVDQVNTLSRACLIVAIAAPGIKTSLKALTAVGGGHMAVVVFETPRLLGAAVLAIRFLDVIRGGATPASRNIRAPRLTELVSTPFVV